MIFEGVNFVPVLIVMGTTLLLLWQLSWKWTLGALIAQYGAIFWLVAFNWTPGLSLVKLVVGLVASGVLVSSMGARLEDAPPRSTSGLIFRSLVLTFLWVIIYFVSSSLVKWLPVEQWILWGGVILFGGGLIQMGMTIAPTRTAIGLLTFLSGFEVIYSALESSVLLAGLLAVLNLGIALTGIYFVSGQNEGEQKP